MDDKTKLEIACLRALVGDLLSEVAELKREREAYQHQEELLLARLKKSEKVTFIQANAFHEIN
jgi:hypothetical protein